MEKAKSNLTFAQRRKDLFNKYRKQKWLLLALLPGMIYYIVFHYAPMYGVIIAFKNYNFNAGILGSPWVGLENFELFLKSPDFISVMKNTLVISFLNLLIGFPAPIIFAIMLNELTNKHYKKIVQTVSYLPHFLSWVVLAGLFTEILSPSRGVINYIITSCGGESIGFLTSNAWFRWVLVFTSMWKEIGWSSIIYLASVTNIDPNLCEAAYVDGANKIKQIIHVTIPSLIPTITIMLIFAVGRIVNDNFDQIYNLYSPIVYPTGDVISTYVYRMGIEKMEYSLASAVGLFKNVIAMTLVLLTNYIANKFGEYGLW